MLKIICLKKKKKLSKNPSLWLAIHPPREHEDAFVSFVAMAATPAPDLLAC